MRLSQKGKFFFENCCGLGIAIIGSSKIFLENSCVPGIVIIGSSKIFLENSCVPGSHPHTADLQPATAGLQPPRQCNVVAPRLLNFKPQEGPVIDLHFQPQRGQLSFARCLSSWQMRASIFSPSGAHSNSPKASKSQE